MFVNLMQNDIKLDLKEVIIIDTGATFSLFCNSKFVKNIEKSLRGINMQTNAGMRKIDTVGTVPGFKRRVWLDEMGMANIFSFADITDQYTVYYNNRIEDAFYVINKDKTVKFVRCSEKLYYYDPKKSHEDGKTFFNTVEENLEGFTNVKI